MASTLLARGHGGACPGSGYRGST